MANQYLIDSPYTPFTIKNQFKAISNGKVFIGKVDQDPLYPLHQIQVYVVDESGTNVPVSQPIQLNAGGYLVYNGHVSKFITLEPYSMAVLDKKNAEVWRVDDISKIDPDNITASGVEDTANGGSVQDFIDAQFSTVAELATGKFKPGQYVRLVDRGLEFFVVNAGGTPDGSSVIDAGSGNTAVLYSKKLASNFNFNLKADPLSFGVKYGSGLSQAQREDNSGYMQECINNAGEVEVKGIIETHGKLILRNGQTISGLNPIVSAVNGFHPTEATFTDATIGRPDDQSNNLWNARIEKLGIRSESSDAVHWTPYQCSVAWCRVQSSLGTGIRHHDGGYQVENTYENNYFYSCLKGISAQAGFRGPTDQYIMDNYFYANGVAERHVDLAGISGSLLKGNHYYGNTLKEYVRLGQGVNVRLVDEYFEGNNGNARLRLEGGNPNSLSLTSCDFWQGNGNATDWEGHQETLIKCSISEGNFFRVGMSSNSFNGGTNRVPIFGFTNGDSTNTGGTSVSFDRSNIISGGYSLLANIGGGNVSDTVIQSNHPEFYVFQSTQNFGFYRSTGSEVFQEDTGSATSFPTLPASVFWLSDKLLVVNNISAATELSFSAGGGTAITGLNPVPPMTRVAITRRGSGYLIFKY